MGRSAILGEQRNNDFVDAACGKGKILVTVSPDDPTITGFFTKEDKDFIFGAKNFNLKILDFAEIHRERSV